MSLKHVLLVNPRLKGYEYGVLRALEAEIVDQTGAVTIEVPDYGLHTVTSRVGHGMRWDPARNYLPKKNFTVEADVIWYVLMGPENYELDLFNGWNLKSKHRIAYIFDTLEPQFEIVKKLFSNDRFNIRITSFHDAVPYLQRLTGSKWDAVEQAVPSSLFKPTTPENKVIDFSSYGRKSPDFHKALLEFCNSNNLYYDYTSHDFNHPVAPEEELYRQYAWHVCHSKFSISWPVELTNPVRAGRLHPVTCRWFEAAMAGTVILGRKPQNELFDELLAPELVVDINPAADARELWKCLDMVYADRDALLAKARGLQQANKERWSWKERVDRMLQLINEVDR